MTAHNGIRLRIAGWSFAVALALAFVPAAPWVMAQSGPVRSETVPDADEPTNAWPEDPAPKPAPPKAAPPKPAPPKPAPVKRKNGYILPGPDGVVRGDPVVEPGDPGYVGPAPRPKPKPQPPVTDPVLEPPKPEPEPIKPEPPKPEPVKPEPPKPEPVKPEPVKPEPVKPDPAPKPPAPQPPVVKPPKFVPPKPVIVPEPGDNLPEPEPKPQPKPVEPPKPEPKPEPKPPAPQPGQEFIPPEAFPEPAKPIPPNPDPQKPEPPKPEPKPEPKPPTQDPEPEPKPQPSSGLIDSGLSDVTGRAFTYYVPGDLKPGTGTGVRSDTIFAPGMRYPIETAPAFPNSQVYGRGGYLGPGGGLCDAANYAYPWRDNFCEKRGWQTPACPGGKGHQGQDIRAMDCKNAVHWVVAAEDGVITKIGSWSVNLKGTSGREYIYLHMRMNNLSVKQGDQVRRGQRLGKVSSDFGGAATSIHLHFEIRANIALPGQPGGFRKVPPYASLVDAYKRLLRGEP